MTIKIVAEIGVNWTSAPEALQMIQEAKSAGAYAVKFQLFNEEVIEESPVKDQLQPLILNENQIQTFRTECDNNKIGLALTPMYLDAFKLAEKYADVIKIRYADHENNDFIDIALRTGKPTLISVPRIPLGDVRYFNPRLHAMYCIPRYPPEPEDFNLDAASICRGFSSHFPHTILDIAWAINRTYEDSYLEKHVMFPRNKWKARPDYGASPEGHEPEDMPLIITPPIDAAVSITFDDLKTLIRQLKIIERIKRTRLT